MGECQLCIGTVAGQAYVPGEARAPRLGVSPADSSVLPFGDLSPSSIDLVIASIFVAVRHRSRVELARTTCLVTGDGSVPGAGALGRR